MTIEMKEIKLHHVKMPLKHPFVTSFGTMNEKEFFITEIIDNDDNHGFGESVAFASPWYTEETVQTNLHMMKDFLIPILRENKIKHPDEVSKLFSPIRQNNMAKAAIEGAIWDLYAKRKGVSLAKAIGGEKTEIDVGISIGIQPTIEKLITKINDALQTGYKRIKLKIEPHNDINLLRAVREHFPHISLMADANSAYTLADIDHLKKLDELNLMMIEQPLGHDDIIDHATLQRELTTPICLDESIHSLADTRKAIELGSCKVVNIKIGRVGGLTEAKRIHDYCAKKGISVWCGGMLESGVGRAHNIALTSLPHFNLPGDTAGSANYWYEDIINPEVVVTNGLIKVPHGNGIGYEIDEDILEKYTINKETFRL